MVLLNLLRDYINYNPKIGIDALYITGNPGSGKGNMLNLITADCVRLRGENVIFPGDIFCEWRHLFRYDIFTEIVLIVPKDIEIRYKEIPTRVIKAIDEVDYEQLEIMDYFPEGTTKKMVIVYDGHLREEIFHDKVFLWSKILSQVVYREFNNFTGFVLPFHEAGAYFPEIAEGDHWHAIKSFTNKFNDARKSYTRIMSCAQLPSEVNTKVRKKSPWRIWRTGTTERDCHRQVKKAVPFQSISNFVLGFGVGGLFVTVNPIGEFQELGKEWRMIPKNIIPKNGKSGANDQRNKIIKKLYLEGFTQERIADLYEMSQQRVQQIIKN